MLSEKVEGISESKTLAITAKAKAMKKKGIDVLGENITRAGWIRGFLG